MNQEIIDEAIYNKYIAPTKQKKDRYIGIEIEMPIVNLDKKAVDIEKVLSKVNDVLPPQPAIRLMVKKGKPGLFDSKLGGIPYYPKDMEYPRGKNNVFANEPMVLLAQLNFEKLL